MMAGLSFEVLRFVAQPASVDVVLLELEGRFRADAVRQLGHPTLLVEGVDDVVEVPAVDAEEASAGPAGSAWRASFAAPTALVGGATFALSVERAMLVELPAPDTPPGSAAAATESHVRLAREANAQRHRAEAAHAATAAAVARADELRAAREQAQAQADRAQADVEQAQAQAEQARLASEELTQRLAAAEEALVEGLAAAEERHAQQLASAQADHARELAAAHEERSQAQRALLEARADLEAARRESERPEHVPPPTKPMIPIADPGPAAARVPAAAWLARGLALAAIAVVLLALVLLVVRPG